MRHHQLRAWARSGRGAGGAAASTVINSAGNLVLQVVAARTLGAAAYGAYTIFFGLLVLLNAIHTAWVGDTLTVLDRFKASIRASLFQSMAVIPAIAAAFALGAAMILRLSDARTGVIFAGLVVLWLVEETFRRLLIARLELWKLVVNDALYVMSSLAAVGVFSLVVGSLSIASILSSMAIGCLVAIMAGVVQLPRSELAPVTLRGAAHREVATFAAWRAAQAGIRPLAQVLARVLIGVFASNAALGRMEAARLVVAPAITVITGASLLLLPLYSKQLREEHHTPTASVRLAMLALFSIAAGYAVFAVLLAEPLSHALTAGTFDLRRAEIAGWATFAVGFALGLPPANYAVARRQSRQVFQIRILDSSVGLLLAVIAVSTGLVSLVPWSIAAGSLLGAALLLRLAERPAPLPEHQRLSTPLTDD